MRFLTVSMIVASNFIKRINLFLVLCAIFLINPCFSQERDFCVEGIYSVDDVEYMNTDSIAVLDREGRKVVIYNVKNKEKVLSFGRKGKGPGEFMQPIDIAHRSGFITVRDYNKRISEFSVEKGDYESSYVTPFIIPTLNEGIEYLGNGSYIIGGLRAKNRKMLHVFDRRKGTIKKSFMGRTQKAVENNITFVNDISFTLENETIISAHTSDYVIGKSSVDGDVLSKKKVEYPNYFKKVPKSGAPDSKSKAKSWMKGYSKIEGVYKLSDSFLATYVNDKKRFGGHVDVIRIKSTKVVESIKVESKLLDAETSINKAVFLLPFGQKPRACFNVVDISYLLSQVSKNN